MAGFDLSFDVWLRLLTSTLMVVGGLLALLAPLGALGMPRRPWEVGVLLPLGLFGVLGTFGEGLRLGMSVQVIAALGQAVTLFCLLAAWLWFRTQAKHYRKPPVDQVPGKNLAEIEGITDLLASGRKIEAIRRVREETGLGLAEAKQAVENLR